MSFLFSPYSPGRRSIANGAPSMDALLLENQRIALKPGDHAVAGHEIPAQNLLRQRILELRLNGALQRPRAVHCVEARFPDLVARLIVQAQSDVAFRQPLPQTAQLDIDDGPNLLASQGMEHHDLVDSIDELGPEMLDHHGH